MPLAHRAERAQAQLAGIAGRGVGDDVEAPTRAVIDESQLDADIEGVQADVTAAVAAHAATVSAAGTHGRLKQVLVAGQDEVGDDTIPITGIAVGDVLISVLVLTTAASIATAAFRALTDFTISAGVLTVGANPADNTNNQYLITYLDAA
jgi:hypothetical protein